jgi:hypothetical protein
MQRFVDFIFKKIRDKQVRIKREKNRILISNVAVCEFYPHFLFFQVYPRLVFLETRVIFRDAFGSVHPPPGDLLIPFFIFLIQFIYTWTFFYN